MDREACRRTIWVLKTLPAPGKEEEGLFNKQGTLHVPQEVTALGPIRHKGHSVRIEPIVTHSKASTLSTEPPKVGSSCSLRVTMVSHQVEVKPFHYS